MPRILDEDEVARLLRNGHTYRSRIAVRAERVAEDSTWTTANGDVLTAKAGDWWVIDGDDRWSVANDVFVRTYDGVGDNQYRKSAPVTAVPIDESFAVDTLEGAASGQRGDWLVRNPTGDCWPVPDAVFARRYERGE